MGALLHLIYIYMYTIFIEVVQNCVTMAFVLDFVFLNYTDAYFLWNKNKIYFIFLYRLCILAHVYSNQTKYFWRSSFCKCTFMYQFMCENSVRYCVLLNRQVNLNSKSFLGCDYYQYTGYSKLNISNILYAWDIHPLVYGQILVNRFK